MARGRIIINEITMDKRINNLSCDTSRLAFTWLVTFADREGRTHGDPALVRSMLFPRRSDVTSEDMAEYLQEWHNCGLIIWYEANDDLWVEFPAFHKHQKGFDSRHEPDSAIPKPQTLYRDGDSIPTDDVRTLPVQCTAEVKRNEMNRNAELSESDDIIEVMDAKPKQRRKATNGKDEDGTPEAQEMFSALAEACGVDWKVGTMKMRGRLNVSGKKLREAEYTPEDVRAFRAWWMANDWRGQKGQLPTPEQVRDAIGQYKAISGKVVLGR